MMEMKRRVDNKDMKWILISEPPKENISVLLTIEIPKYKAKPKRGVVIASYQRFSENIYEWMIWENDPSIIYYPVA